MPVDPAAPDDERLSMKEFADLPFSCRPVLELMPRLKAAPLGTEIGRLRNQCSAFFD